MSCRTDSDGTAKATLSDFGLAVDPAQGVQVFDITNDPGRGTDLFQAYDPATRIVTMAGIQAAGRTLEIRFQGTAPVKVAVEAFTHVTAMPVIELEIDVSRDGRQSGGVVTESNAETKVSRTRLGPRWMKAACRATCVDSDRRRVVQIAGALRRAFEDVGFVRSLATGEDWPIGDVRPFDSSIALTDGVHTARIGFDTWIREDSRAYDQAVPVSEIVVRSTGEALGNVRPALDPTRTWYDGEIKVV